jgi:DNA polymerase V
VVNNRDNFEYYNLDLSIRTLNRIDSGKNKINFFDQFNFQSESIAVVKFKGHLEASFGIHNGDILIVDRNVDPINNLVIADLAGEITIQKVNKYNNKFYIIHEGINYKPVEITSSMKFVIWGVITYIIHKA